MVETAPPGYWLANNLSTSCFNWKMMKPKLILSLLWKPGTRNNQVAKPLKNKDIIYMYAHVPVQFYAAAVRCGLFDWRAALVEKRKLLQWLDHLLQSLWEETYP